MRRRDFLRLVGLGVVGSEIDWDRLLWIPNQKRIFIPSAKQIEVYKGGILTLDKITQFLKDFTLQHYTQIYHDDNALYNYVKSRIDSSKEE